MPIRNVSRFTSLRSELGATSGMLLQKQVWSSVTPSQTPRNTDPEQTPAQLTHEELAPRKGGTSAIQMWFGYNKSDQKTVVRKGMLRTSRE